MMKTVDICPTREEKWLVEVPDLHLVFRGVFFYTTEIGQWCADNCISFKYGLHEFPVLIQTKSTEFKVIWLLDVLKFENDHDLALFKLTWL